jgi:vacuolar protein sorting-associated protein 13A/C
LFFFTKEIFFKEETAELINSKGHRKIAKRQALDGLWVEYAWTVSRSTLHLRLNRVQIDNQLDHTMFPVMLHPIISKATGTDAAEKPFIELSVYETKTARSNIMQFKYFKLLIQEFAVKIDQGLIVALLAFMRAESVRSLEFFCFFNIFLVIIFF